MTAVGGFDGPTWQALREAVASGAGIRKPRELPTGVEWRRFLALVERHRVGALIHRSEWARAVVAPGVIAKLADDARAATLGSLRLLALQHEALRALGGAAIDVLVLKGAPLAHEAYGAAAGRHPGDLDLLIAPERVVEAVGILRDHGFRWYGIDAPADMRTADGGLAALSRADSLLVKEAQLYRMGHHVDLHWRLTVNPALLPVERHWLSTPRLVKLPGGVVPVLPSLPGWWYLLVHGAEHEWRRLKWVADVPALARANPELLSAAALESASRAGLERCVASGMAIAERLLGPFLPPPAAAWVASARGIERLVNRSMQAIASDESTSGTLGRGQLTAYAAARMALRTDTRYRVAEVRSMLVQAGRNQLDPRPGLAALARGPRRWLLRSAQPPSE